MLFVPLQHLALLLLLQVPLSNTTAIQDLQIAERYFTVIVHYPSSTLDACFGRLKVASSVDGFQETVPLHLKTPDTYESKIFYPIQSDGTRGTVSLLWDVELWQGVVPPQCKAKCVGFSLALMESLGHRLQFVLPKGGLNSSIHSWPSFCGMRNKSHRTRIWSASLNRSFNFTVTQSALGVGDFHSDLAFKARAPKALRALFASVTLSSSMHHGSTASYMSVDSPQVKPWNDPWLSSTSAPEFVHVQLNGTTYRLWAQAVGPPQASVSILILNGGPGKPHTELDGLSSELSDHKLVYWDSLGSQGSDCFLASERCTWHPKTWGTLDDFVAQAQAVMTHFKLEPANTILLAHSFGVVLALELASRSLYASQYLGLVLSDWVASQTLVRSWLNTHACLLTEPQGAYLRPDCLYIDTVKAPPSSVVYTFNSTNPGPLSWFVWGPNGDGEGGWIHSWDCKFILPKIMSPSLWIVGGFDLVNPIDVNACGNLMPRGRFVKVAAAGHNSFADVPREWISELKAWLRTELRLPAEQSLSSRPELRQSVLNISNVVIPLLLFVVGAAVGSMFFFDRDLHGIRIFLELP